MQDFKGLALDGVFAAFGQVATYDPPDGGDTVAVTVILRAPDVMDGLSEGRQLAVARIAEVRVAECAVVKEGGMLIVGGEMLRIKTVTKMDPSRLVWTLGLAG